MDPPAARGAQPGGMQLRRVGRTQGPRREPTALVFCFVVCGGGLKTPWLHIHTFCHQKRCGRVVFRLSVREGTSDGDALLADIIARAHQIRGPVKFYHIATQDLEVGSDAVQPDFTGTGAVAENVRRRRCVREREG